MEDWNNPCISQGMNSLRNLIAICLIFVSSLIVAQNISFSAVEQNPVKPDGVPRLVKFSGTAATLDAGRLPRLVGMTFSLYDEGSQTPIWSEVQNVQVDRFGKFTVLLGAGSADGLPQDIFRDERARWITFRIETGEESARELLLSVPYALKAADTGMLAGIAGSEYVLRSEWDALNSKAAESRSVQRSGDHMTGPLSLPSLPTDDLHAVPKAYVDATLSSVHDRLNDFAPLANPVFIGDVKTTGSFVGHLKGRSEVADDSERFQGATWDRPADIGNTLPANGRFSQLSSRVTNNLRSCHEFPGANAGQKISACIADLPTTGGIADARGLQGDHVVTDSITIDRPVTVLFSAVKLTLFAPIIGTASNISLIGDGATVLQHTRPIGLQGTEAMIFFTGGADLIENIRVEGLTFRGVQVDGSATRTTLLRFGTNIRGIWVLNNEFRDSSSHAILLDGVFNGSGSGIWDVVVRNNRFSEHYECAITFGGFIHGAVVQGNIIRATRHNSAFPTGAGPCGISAEPPRAPSTVPPVTEDMRITDNSIDLSGVTIPQRNNTSGIALGEGNSTPRDYVFKRVTISNNQIRGAGRGILINPIRRGSPSLAGSIIISTNIVEAARAEAIMVGGTANTLHNDSLVVAGNVVYGASESITKGFAAIAVGTVAYPHLKAPVIVGNLVFSRTEAGGTSSKHGIALAPGVMNAVIGNNSLYSNGSSDLAILSQPGAMMSGNNLGLTGSVSGFRPDQTIYGVSGSSASPSFSFADEPSSGVFRSSAGVLRISLLGNSRYIFENRQFIPAIGDFIHLGSGTNRWASVNAVNGTFAGSVTATGGLVGDLTGTASTARAIAKDPDDCAAGEFANAIAANGNLSCSRVFISTTVTVGFEAWRGNDCQQQLLTVDGVQDGDGIILNLPAALAALPDVLFTYWTSGANQVGIRGCKITPGHLEKVVPADVKVLILR